MEGRRAVGGDDPPPPPATPATRVNRAREIVGERAPTCLGGFGFHPWLRGGEGVVDLLKPPEVCRSDSEPSQGDGNLQEAPGASGGLLEPPGASAREPGTGSGAP